MIENKNQFIKKLKENKNNIIIKRIYNLEEDNKIKVGAKSTIYHVQSNAYTNYWNGLNKATWNYFQDITIKDNKIFYYNPINDEQLERLKKKNIKFYYELLTDKEKGKYNKNNNFNYKYKIILFINEIMEV